MSHANNKGQGWYFDRDLCFCPKQYTLLFFFYLASNSERSCQIKANSPHLGPVQVVGKLPSGSHLQMKSPNISLKGINQLWLYQFSLYVSVYLIYWSTRVTLTALKGTILTVGCTATASAMNASKTLSRVVWIERDKCSWLINKRWIQDKKRKICLLLQLWKQ